MAGRPAHKGLGSSMRLPLRRPASAAALLGATPRAAAAAAAAARAPGLCVRAPRARPASAAPSSALPPETPPPPAGGARAPPRRPRSAPRAWAPAEARAAWGAAAAEAGAEQLPLPAIAERATLATPGGGEGARSLQADQAGVAAGGGQEAGGGGGHDLVALFGRSRVVGHRGLHLLPPWGAAGEEQAPPPPVLTGHVSSLLPY
jgi:hypothetical protein